MSFAWWLNVGGWLGVAMVLIAYSLVSTRRTQGDSFFYQTLNIVGSLLLLANACYYGAYPSVGVNIAWIAIASFALYNARRQKGE